MKWRFKYGKKKKKQKSATPKVAPVKNRTYPDKVILAWAEAVIGNKKIQDWLVSNGYEELHIFVFALHNKEDARIWLLENGFAHLMAMINCAEGNDNAFNWLENHGFETLKYVGIAGDGRKEGYLWLKRFNLDQWIHLAQNIQKVKDQLEETHNDIHSFGND